MYQEAPGPRPGPRERDVYACIRRHQAFALPSVRERRVRVYKEAPGFRPGPRGRQLASTCTTPPWLAEVKHSVLGPVGMHVQKGDSTVPRIRGLHSFTFQLNLSRV